MSLGLLIKPEADAETRRSRCGTLTAVAPLRLVWVSIATLALGAATASMRYHRAVDTALERLAWR